MEKYSGKIIYYFHRILLFITVLLCLWAQASVILKQTNVFVAKGWLAPFSTFFLAVISSLLFWFITFIFSISEGEVDYRRKVRSHAVDILIAILATGSSQYVFWYKEAPDKTDTILAIFLIVGGLCLTIRSILFFIKHPPSHLLEI